MHIRKMIFCIFIMQDYDVTDVNGQITVTEKDEMGNITKIVKPDGSSLEYEYDSLNNLLKEINNAKGHTVVKQYTYEALNRPEKVYLKSVSFDEGTKKDNTVYEYYLDKNVYGLVKTKSTLRYADKKEWVVEEFDYNDAGELIKEKIGDRITYTGHRYGIFTTPVYCDVNGSLISVEAPNNSYERGIFYVCASIKPSGNIEIIQYDSKLNPVKTTLRNAEEAMESTSLIVYDKFGRKIREVSPNVYHRDPSAADSLERDCHIYTYYDNGLVKTYQDPENNITRYIYNANGNIERETTPSGAEYIYEYDGLGRITRQKFIDPVYGNEEVLLEESIYIKGESIEGLSPKKASKKVHIKYIDENTSLRTDTYFDYEGRETIIENPYGKIYKEYYGDGNLKSESVYNKNIKYGSTFYTLASRSVYYYNSQGLLDVSLMAHKEENNWISYFITKYGYTDDGLLDYEVNWLDAVEILNISDKTPLPKDRKANVKKYSYNELGSVTNERNYIGNVPLVSGEPSISGKV